MEKWHQYSCVTLLHLFDRDLARSTLLRVTTLEFLHFTVDRIDLEYSHFQIEKPRIVTHVEARKTRELT